MPSSITNFEHLATIVIPTYNRCQLLAWTLNSLQNQTISDKFEVIVVDDGSSDGTKGVVDSFRHLLNLKYAFQENLGNRTAAARNVGISLANSDVIIFIDSGMLLASNCIEEHIRVHYNEKKACAVVGYAYGFDSYQEPPQLLRNLIDVNNPDLTISHLRKTGLFPDMRESLFDSVNYRIDELPAPWALFITCNCSVRKSILDKTGYFDENLDYRWGVEDLELGYRLHQLSVHFRVNRNAVAIHYPHDYNYQEKINEELVNKVYFHKKHKSIGTELFLTCGFLEINSLILMKSPKNEFIE